MHHNENNRLLRRSFQPLLMLGHLVNDMFSFLISGLLPVFTVIFGLSYLFAGVIAMVFNLTSCILQPFFGRWFDRSQAAWLLETGLLLNCIGMSLVGISPNYVVVVFLIGTAGVGAAAFHPPAFSAVLKSSTSKGSAMGLFVSGGFIGQFLGPIVAGSLVSILGPPGTLALLPIGLIVAVWLYRTHFQQEVRPVRIMQSRPAKTPLLILLATVTALRSITVMTAITFLPLYFVKIGDSLLVATAITSMYMGFAVLGQVGGGFLSDRMGERRLVITSLISGSLLFYGFQASKGYLSLILLAVSGILLYANWAAIIVMSCQAAPDNVGAVSGFMLGFSVGIGGIASVAFGAVGDAIGLTYAFSLVAGAALIGGVIALFIPRHF
jgi:FSR family fosmidomycin resistance protein-like MFS transporter